MKSADCAGWLYYCYYLTFRCFAAITVFSSVCVICIVLQVVSAIHPKGFKVIKDQDANKESKSEKVFIPCNATPKFS